eukprot:scaffold66008_cov33-Tisochrysis_lutea.AAC.1
MGACDGSFRRYICSSSRSTVSDRGRSPECSLASVTEGKVCTGFVCTEKVLESSLCHPKSAAA